MWQWPTGAWDGTEPNAAAVADQYTIATRGLGARARCHHEQRHVPPWQQLPVRPYTTQAKEASTALHRGAAAELPLGNVRHRGCQPRLRTTGCGRKQTSITAKPSPQFCNLASWLFRSRNRAAVAHRVRAMARAWMLELRQRRSSCPMARRSTRGPCAVVSRGRQAAQRASTGMSMPFRQGRMPCRKARPRLTDLPGRKPGKRQAGWPSLWVTFLLATQEKSDSAAEGRRKLFALRAASPQAYRLKCDACLHRHDGVGDRGFPRFRGEAEPIVPR